MCFPPPAITLGLVCAFPLHPVFSFLLFSSSFPGPSEKISVCWRLFLVCRQILSLHKKESMFFHREFFCECEHQQCLFSEARMTSMFQRCSCYSKTKCSCFTQCNVTGTVTPKPFGKTHDYSWWENRCKTEAVTLQMGHAVIWSLIARLQLKQWSWRRRPILQWLCALPSLGC